MNTIRKDGSDKKEWLSLRVGDQISLESRPMKVYACSFCKRKFYSSQALGGHQNAHKRERDAVRRYYSPKSLDHFAMVNRSLGIQAHSLKTRDGETSVARFINDGAQYYYDGDDQEAAEMKWPGGFYFEAPPAAYQPSDEHILDLNLRL